MLDSVTSHPRAVFFRFTNDSIRGAHIGSGMPPCMARVWCLFITMPQQLGRYAQQLRLSSQVPYGDDGFHYAYVYACFNYCAVQSYSQGRWSGRWWLLEFCLQSYSYLTPPLDPPSYFFFFLLTLVAFNSDVPSPTSPLESFVRIYFQTVDYRRPGPGTVVWRLFRRPV